MIFQEKPYELLTVYIAFGTIILVNLYFAFKVLKQERKWINYQFSGVLISVIIGLTLSLVTRPIADILIREISYKFTIFFLAFGPIFMLTFCVSFYNSIKGIDILSRKKQGIILLLFGIILSFSFLIPNGVTVLPNGILMLSLTYYLFIILVLSIGIIIPIYYLALGVIYKHLENERLKKKWVIFMIGVTILLSEIYSVLTSNTFYNPIIFSVLIFVNFIFSLVGAYLIYYGVGKEFKS
jgi:hypothetical protein